MDIVLDILDTFVFDRFYSSFWPALPGPGVINSFQNMPNATTWNLGNAATAPLNNYQYKPASQYISVAPSQWAYLTSWPRDDPYRQLLSLYLTTWIFGVITYFVFATLSFIFIFDKSTMKHPKFLKNQIALEIYQTMWSMPLMAIFTAPLFWLEVQGHSKLYDTTSEGPGFWYNIVQFPLFIAFTDFWIYWIHRGLHHPILYKTLHKPHHKWIMPTPFASHAFHPIDGFSQSVPYHAYPFLFPLQKWAYVALFVFINFWTILIHDGEYIANNPVVNGAACHSIHHMEFLGNYGQFTTLPDRMGGTYRKPDETMFLKGDQRGDPKSVRDEKKTN